MPPAPKAPGVSPGNNFRASMNFGDFQIPDLPNFDDTPSYAMDNKGARPLTMNFGDFSIPEPPSDFSSPISHDTGFRPMSMNFGNFSIPEPPPDFSNKQSGASAGPPPPTDFGDFDIDFSENFGYKADFGESTLESTYTPAPTSYGFDLLSVDLKADLGSSSDDDDKGKTHQTSGKSAGSAASAASNNDWGNISDFGISPELLMTFQKNGMDFNALPASVRESISIQAKSKRMSDAEFARFFQKSLLGQDPMEMTFSSFDLGPGGDKDIIAGIFFFHFSGRVHHKDFVYPRVK